MEYSRFVERGQPLWDSFEETLVKASTDADRVYHQDLEDLALGYRRILHDHALARARFPGTGVARRLERLALEGTHFLHADHQGGLPGPGRFFRETFPRAFRRHLPHAGIAAALFLTSALFGLSLAFARPEAGTALLGPQAVSDLREGRLWTDALTSVVPAPVSSAGIATNNMSVAITAWAGGALGGTLTLYVVLMNGFMLGALVGATSAFGLAGRLLEFVAAHGILEITLILVASGAGLRVGHATLAAGDRPRREAMSEAGRESLLLLLGCLPWFVLLGIVEGVVSPSPAVPATAKLGIGLALEGTFLAAALLPPLGRHG
jgi:uncharacterized membrane protein SpoIIM required for sporulation